MADNDLSGVEIANNSIGRLDSAIKRTRGSLSNDLVDTRSVVQRAKNSIMEFPVYVTRSIRVDQAQVISKMMERVYTTFVQSVLNQNQIVNEDQVQNLDFLKNFHTNINECTDISYNEFYDPIDDLDHMIQDSIAKTCELHNGVIVEYAGIKPNITLINNECKRLSKSPLEDFYYLSDVVMESSNDSSDGVEVNPIELRQALIDADSNIDDPNDRCVDDNKINMTNARKAMDRGLVVYNGAKVSAVSSGLGYKYYIKSDSISGLNSADVPSILKDGDVKKMNDMVPFTIRAKFIVRSKGKPDATVEYVIGIKTILHIIDIKSLEGDLQDITRGSINSLQYVRYKTGEISMVDYLLNLDSIKSDAVKHTHADKRWINTLRRLGDYNKFHGTFFKRHLRALNNASASIPVPNGTFVLSNIDIEALRGSTGIDMSKHSSAVQFSKQLFLIAFVIVDSAENTIKISYVNDSKDWEIHPISSIDQEMSRRDTSSINKEIGRLINR